MKYLISIFSISIIFFCKSNFAETIAVVNIQTLIDNNNKYIKILKKIETSQEEYSEKLKKKEFELNKMLNDIEDSKLILNESEINLQIQNYNKELTNFNTLVDEFNYHYQNQVINIRQNILKEIISLLEEYALKNNIDLILDSTTYLIASNSIDITNNINKKLIKINFKLEYEEFKKN